VSSKVDSPDAVQISGLGMVLDVGYQVRNATKLPSDVLVAELVASDPPSLAPTEGPRMSCEGSPPAHDGPDRSRLHPGQVLVSEDVVMTVVPHPATFVASGMAQLEGFGASVISGIEHGRLR
jgi:hypothetical protein